MDQERFEQIVMECAQEYIDGNLLLTDTLRHFLSRLREEQKAAAWVTPLHYGSRVTFYKPPTPDEWNDDIGEYYCMPLFTVPPAPQECNCNELVEVLNHPNWNRVWTLLNAFASGETQNSFQRVEPIGVLGEVYFLLAEIDADRREAIAKRKAKTKGVEEPVT